MRANTDVRTVCVFTPPVTNQEVHDDDGAYPLIVEAATAANGTSPRIVARISDSRYHTRVKL